MSLCSNNNLKLEGLQNSEKITSKVEFYTWLNGQVCLAFSDTECYKTLMSINKVFSKQSAEGHKHRSKPGKMTRCRQ